MPSPALASAIAAVPAGARAVGVSGGADSVALLAFLRLRKDLRLHVVHLDHQTRGADSTADAAFVRELAAAWGLACTIALRSDVEQQMPSPPANPSARYRAARQALFRRVVAENNLAGVLLAHHADDQAQTILHRLLRNSGPMNLGGMQAATRINGLQVMRPLLGITPSALRQFLLENQQPWREDASNASDKYFRNRLRRLLEHEPALTADLLALGDACQGFSQWARDAAPVLGEAFPASQLTSLPPVLANESAWRWLLLRGAPAGEVGQRVVSRLLAMAADAARAGKAHFPGSMLVRRKRGIFTASPLPAHRRIYWR
ncbi:MAG TPA: tRNA lysidine(34) synthetase TilS [Tepidisphaeraceae bacterium]|nr:tRNA lysidine(34) synthetase TilS [Tepidisphaeraceae bacterium]